MAVTVELNDHTREIFSTLCFHAAKVAELMRRAGYEHAPKQKAEDEQAVVIHWKLKHYLESGEKWKDAANAEARGWYDKVFPPEDGASPTDES